jgi:hypothetical protein
VADYDIDLRPDADRAIRGISDPAEAYELFQVIQSLQRDPSAASATPIPDMEELFIIDVGDKRIFYWVDGERRLIVIYDVMNRP